MNYIFRTSQVRTSELATINTLIVLPNWVHMNNHKHWWPGYLHLCWINAQGFVTKSLPLPPYPPIYNFFYFFFKYRVVMVAYFCPLITCNIYVQHATSFLFTCDLHVIIYVNMQNNYVDMQHNLKVACYKCICIFLLRFIYFTGVNLAWLVIWAEFSICRI